MACGRSTVDWTNPTMRTTVVWEVRTVGDAETAERKNAKAMQPARTQNRDACCTLHMHCHVSYSLQLKLRLHAPCTDMCVMRDTHMSTPFLRVLSVCS